MYPERGLWQSLGAARFRNRPATSLQSFHNGRLRSNCKGTLPFPFNNPRLLHQISSLTHTDLASSAPLRMDLETTQWRWKSWLVDIQVKCSSPKLFVALRQVPQSLMAQMR